MDSKQSTGYLPFQKMVLHVKIGRVLPFLAHPAKSHLEGRASAHSKPLAEAGYYV